MNYSRAFTYVFEDKDWVSKILIAGLIGLIPVIGQIYLFGWMIEIIRRTRSGRQDILPRTHFGPFLTMGLKMLVVYLIYSIPVILLSTITNLIFKAPEYSDSGTTFTIIFTGVSCLGGLISFVLKIAIALFEIYGMIKLAETDQIKACLDFRDGFECIKANLGSFVILALLMIVTDIIKYAGLILCIVGIIFTAPYAAAVLGSLTGQLWNSLDSSDENGRPFRGAAEKKADDVIEEAPFTKVEDIEKSAAETAVPDDVITNFTAPAAEIVEEAADAAEEAAKEAVEEAAEAAEAAVEEAAEQADVLEPVENIAPVELPDFNDESAAETEEKKDDDLPSFE